MEPHGIDSGGYFALVWRTIAAWILSLCLKLNVTTNSDNGICAVVNSSAEENLIISQNAKYNAAMTSVAEVLGGYQSGFKVVNGSHPQAIEKFAVLSARGVPRLMLPLANAALRTSVSSYIGNHRLAALVVPSMIKVSARLGSPLQNISSVVSLTSATGAPSALRELLADVLGNDKFHIALRLSFGRPNAKTVALAISEEGEALCYGKFGSESMTNELVAHESAVFDRFEGKEMPVVLPRRLFSGVWANKHNALITTPLRMTPLKKDAVIAHRAADSFASRHLDSKGALKDSVFWHTIIERVNKLDELSGPDRPLMEAIAKIEQNWGDQQFDFCASHGDWTRANLGIVDGQVAALDWERSTTNSPRGIDIAHFAICEQSFNAFRKTLNINQLADNVSKYQKDAGQTGDNADILILLSLLQMVVRFKSARKAGVQSTDSKFGPALQAGLRQWLA